MNWTRGIQISQIKKKNYGHISILTSHRITQKSCKHLKPTLYIVNKSVGQIYAASFIQFVLTVSL